MVKWCISSEDMLLWIGKQFILNILTELSFFLAEDIKELWKVKKVWFNFSGWGKLRHRNALSKDWNFMVASSVSTPVSTVAPQWGRKSPWRLEDCSDCALTVRGQVRLHLSVNTSYIISILLPQKHCIISGFLNSLLFSNRLKEEIPSLETK